MQSNHMFQNHESFCLSLSRQIPWLLVKWAVASEFNRWGSIMHYVNLLNTFKFQLFYMWMYFIVQNLGSTRGKFFNIFFPLFSFLILTLNQLIGFPNHPEVGSNRFSNNSLRNKSLSKIASTAVPVKIHSPFSFLKFSTSKYLLLSNSLPIYFSIFLP